MNKTQKSISFGLAISGVSAAVFAYEFHGLIVTNDLPNHIIPAVAFFVVIAFWFFTIGRKKANPDRAVCDERDALIKQRALNVSYLSTWVLLAVFSSVCYWGLGSKGLIKAPVIPFVFSEMFFVVMFIYFLAVTIQYRCGGNQNE
jgi:hypothetical protein